MSNPRVSDGLPLPAPLKLFLSGSVALTILSFVYTIICRRIGLGLPYSFPYYYVPNAMFRDMDVFLFKIEAYGTPRFFSDDSGYFMYPAPLVHVFRWLLHSPGHPRWRYLGMTVIVLVVLCATFFSALQKKGMSKVHAIFFIFTTAAVSYPLLVLLQRFNLEVLVWFLTSIGIWQFYRNRPTISAIALGAAASLKLYPIILLGLYLPRRRYGAFLLAITVFVVITLFSLWLIGPTIGVAYAWNSGQIKEFSQHYAGNLVSLGYDHSFLALLKAFTLPWHLNMDPWVRPYTVTAALASVILYFIRIWKLPLVNQILALSVLHVTLAPVSYDYTLLNLYPAFAILVLTLLEHQRVSTSQVPLATSYFVFFALIFTPESYVILWGNRYGAELRSLCLLAILVLSLSFPILSGVDPRSISLKERRT